MKFITCFLILVIYSCFLSAATEDKGYFYFYKYKESYSNHDFEKGDSFLKKAVENGNVRAMCYYAKANMISVWNLGAESTKYYQIAMSKKEPCGYFALMNTGSNPLWKIHQSVTDVSKQVESLSEVKKIIYDRIKSGEVNLSTYYFFLAKGKSEEEDALLEGSKLGNAWASYTYAEGIKNGHYGWFLTERNRAEEAVKWYYLSAKQGNIETYLNIAEIYKDLGEYSEYEQWLLKGINADSARSMITLAYAYSSYQNELLDKKNRVLKPNDHKAYEYCYILSHQLPVYFSLKMPDGTDSDIAITMSKAKNKLTSNEISETEKNANEWMKTHRVHYWFADIE